MYDDERRLKEAAGGSRRITLADLARLKIPIKWGRMYARRHRIEIVGGAAPKPPAIEPFTLSPPAEAVTDFDDEESTEEIDGIDEANSDVSGLERPGMDAPDN